MRPEKDYVKKRVEPSTRIMAYSGRGYSVWIDGTRYGGTTTTPGRLLHKGDRVRLFVTSGGLVAAVEPA